MASLVGGGGEGGGNGGGRDELKTQFSTREGTYQLVSAVDFSRTTRPTTTYVTSNTNSTAASAPGTSPPVRLSFVQVPPGGQDIETGIETGTGGGGSLSSLASPTNLVSPSALNSSSGLSPSSEEHNSDLDSSSSNHLFCFNMGKELLVYPFVGCKKIVDINKPIDKRGYKGTNPTCHDFNSKAASSSNLPLLIGFSGGQIQYVDSMYKEVNKLFNEERVIDKTRVTCIRWLPNSATMFLVAHASGHLYLYNADSPCGTTAPHYQQTKVGPGYSVWNCKTKIPRNPVTRWTVGDGAINEFAFSPCGQFLAIVSQDGFLRIFKYETLELVGLTRSYFGGLLCVGWSPDGNYVCVGGEDDLVTLWSFNERRVVARGQGHKSWVAAVSFDPFTTTYGTVDMNDMVDSNGGECNRNSHGECLSPGCVFSCDPVTSGAQGSSGSSLCASCASQQQLNNSSHSNTGVKHRNLINSTNNVIPRNSVSSVSSKMVENLRISSTSESASNTRIPACYRVGSVGQDTQLCLWDLTEDVIKHFKQSLNEKSRPLSQANSELSPHSNSRIINNQSLTNTWNSHPISNTDASSSNNQRHAGHQSESSDELRNAASRGANGESSSSSTANPNTQSVTANAINGNQKSTTTVASTNGASSNSSQSNHSSGHSILSLRFGALSFGSGDKSSGSKDKDHKRNFSLGSSKNEKNSYATTKGSGGNGSSAGGASGGILGLGVGVNLDDPLKLIGTQACPRLDECPLLEPLVCKKISHERLTSLTFREESIVTACQDGIICTWARPGDVVSQL